MSVSDICTVSVVTLALTVLHLIWTTLQNLVLFGLLRTTEIHAALTELVEEVMKLKRFERLQKTILGPFLPDNGPKAPDPGHPDTGAMDPEAA